MTAIQKSRVYTASTQRIDSLVDRWLLGAVIGLMIIGLLMVASSSIMLSTSHYKQPFHFLIRQSAYLFAGIVTGFGVVKVDMRVWQRINIPLLLFCVILLVIVLIPGIGRSVNGSRRWLALGPVGIQVSEIAKLGMVFYIAGYLMRHKNQVNCSIRGFLNPMLVLAVVAFLLMLEPDFGATVVICSTVMILLFLAGVKLRYYLALVIIVGLALAALAISSPYRVARLTAFLNPWADQFNSGYQLTQSLIAFGRGGYFGVGFGESVQKLFYLPESHTDFLFAVLAEETGLVGILVVMILYSILIYRGVKIAYTAHALDQFFSAWTAYGITVWLGLQAFINMGVNAGLLPTKGLTLPFLSYGGASIGINCIVIALLIRVDYENRWKKLTTG